MYNRAFKKLDRVKGIVYAEDRSEGTEKRVFISGGI